MSLPLTRETTYAAGAPVKAADLNALQDAVVAGAHGDLTMTVNAYALARSGSVSMAGSGDAQWAGAGSVLWAPPLHTGDRVVQLKLRVYGDGVADFTVGAYVVSPAATTTQICPGGTTYAITNPSAAWADVTINLIDTTLAAGEALLIEIAGNGANLRLLSAALTYYHPLP